ncbi:MAG: dihydrodipicolinate synthase family protein [Deltaproteobacteria bacterium]|nr:dihydrodipicolinate synthase family protein [Deltaproteobacteria bacterium]
MKELKHMQGVLSPVVTPFKKDLAPDTERLVAHCRWLLSQNCGLAVFGTNSEANSLSGEERMGLLEALAAAGLDPARMMPGTGCSSLTETAKLTAHAVRLGVGGALMLPPFYYKGVSDEGLFRHYSEVIQRVGSERLRVYLYHIPQVTQVPISLGLIERLLKAYPKAVAGVKDSSGDWANTEAMLKAFPGWGVFSGNELVLLKNMQGGGVGCISATANVNPGPIHHLWANWKAPQAQGLQDSVNAIRQWVQTFPMIPALKAIVGHYGSDPAWRTVRPPLVELTPEQNTQLLQGLEARKFAMPGLRAA